MQSIRPPRIQSFHPYDQQITLIYYCGNEEFRYLADPTNPDLYHNTFADIIYYIPGTDPERRPCRGLADLGVTAQGQSRFGPQRLVYAVILCRGALETDRVSTLEKLPQPEPAVYGETYGFNPSVEDTAR
ncbi:MAG: hypothetical protein Q9190_000029 [Brigantiaea leucoxantha]